MTDYLDTMVRQYAETALWSSIGEDGDPLDSLYTTSDIELETLDEMAEDCASFLEACRADLDGMEPGQAGHDFWLTRNRHGAGFWDRGLGDRGDRLTSMAHPYGEVNLYVGDDGLIHG